MAQTLAGKDQWYVVHVLSGQENKVRENILKRVKTEEMRDLIYDVLVPTERVSEIKKGKKSETTRKFFPGYLIANMIHLYVTGARLLRCLFSDYAARTVILLEVNRVWGGHDQAKAAPLH